MTSGRLDSAMFRAFRSRAAVERTAFPREIAGGIAIVSASRSVVTPFDRIASPVACVSLEVHSKSAARAPRIFG